MAKFKLEGREYDTDKLSEHAKELVVSLNLTSNSINEARGMHALLLKAKRAYIAELKSEMIAAKAGLEFDNE